MAHVRSPLPLPRALGAALLGGALVLGGACTREATPSDPAWTGTLIPLDLRPVNDARVDAPRVIERLHPPEGLARSLW